MTPRSKAAVLALLVCLSCANLYLLLADASQPVSPGHDGGGIHRRQAARESGDEKAGLRQHGPSPTPPTLRVASFASALPLVVQPSAPSAEDTTATDNRSAASAVVPLQSAHAPSPRFMLRPAANAACIEMDDLRLVLDRCEATNGRGGGETTAAAPTAAEPFSSESPFPSGASSSNEAPLSPLPRIACPRSLESDCAHGFASPAAHCLLRPTLLLPARLTWRNVIFAAAIFDDGVTADLIQAAADTWLQMTGGAELFLATDGDDARTDEQIAPSTIDSISVTVYRCPTCRGIRCPPASSAVLSAPFAASAHPTDSTHRSILVQPAHPSRSGQPEHPSHPSSVRGCVGRREGWLARTKVLDMFRAMAERYLGGGQTPPDAAAKLFFIKFDPDTILLPHSLIRLLREIHSSLDPLAPLLMGMAACRAHSPPPGHTPPTHDTGGEGRGHPSPLCHAAGGAGYILSPPALLVLRGIASGSRRVNPEAAAAANTASPTAADVPAAAAADITAAAAAAPASSLAAAPPLTLPDLFSAVDGVSYGGEDVTVAFALKQLTGASVLNCGSFYQHNPEKYARMRAKGELWVQWPLSRSPVSFHKFKQPDQLRTFFSCALYDSKRRPRPFPRSLLPPTNASRDAADALYRCADPWQPPPR